MRSRIKLVNMKLSQRKIIIVTAALIFLACFFAVYLRLFTGKELWYEMFAAVLGVIITAIITMILLRGQSDTDIERERAAKIFEEKLKIYQEYLHTLCEVVKDRSLSDEEKMLLEFQTSYVAMHCDSQYIATVSTAVRRLIGYICPDEESKESNMYKSNSPDPLLDNLFCIVEAFRKDLYGDDFKFDSDYKQKTLENFSEAYRNAKSPDIDKNEEPQRLSVDLNVLSLPIKDYQCTKYQENIEVEEANHNIDQETKVTADKELWDNAVARWTAEGWRVDGMSESQQWFAMFKQNGDPGAVIVECYKGAYRVRALYTKNDADFSKPLKWEKGGRRVGGIWWQYLAEPYCRTERAKFVETLYSNREMQQYVIGLVDNLKDCLNKHHNTVILKDKVGNHEGWYLFVWYWSMLACEWHSEEDGVPYIDIYEDGDSGKVLIRLGNRKNDDALLEKILKRIGCADKITVPNGYVLLETVQTNDADTVAERVRYWINKITA